jgi:hypothetical protein
MAGSYKRKQRSRQSINHSSFLLFTVVLIKFTAPRIEDTPARCKEKMARSTDAPA